MRGARQNDLTFEIQNQYEYSGATLHPNIYSTFFMDISLV